MFDYMYFDDLSSYTIFKQCEKCDIMYVVMLMKPRLHVSDEEIITQGDEAKQMYIIIQGQVRVYL